MDQLVSFEIAKLAKERGFCEPTLFYRQKSAVIGNNTILPLTRDDEEEDWNNYSLQVPYYSIPTQATLQKWFREKFQIHVRSYKHRHNGKFYPYYCGEVVRENPYCMYTSTNHLTFEKGLEDALKEAFSLL